MEVFEAAQLEKTFSTENISRIAETNIVAGEISNSELMPKSINLCEYFEENSSDNSILEEEKENTLLANSLSSSSSRCESPSSTGSSSPVFFSVSSPSKNLKKRMAFNEIVKVEPVIQIKSTNDEPNVKKEFPLPLSHTELRLQAKVHFLRKLEYTKRRLDPNITPNEAIYYMQASRHHALEMTKFDNQAAEMIFRANNKNGYAANLLDLHYLYVKEAVYYLAKYFKDRCDFMRLHQLDTLKLKIVCGRGKRSDPRGPMIGPAVTRYLKKLKYEFSGRHQDGYLLVTLIRKNWNSLIV